MIICGTGHRPNKVGGYSKEAFDKLVSLARTYLTAGEQIDIVISGGALGWDQALAEAALGLGIPIHLYLPFPGFEDRWPNESKAFLHSQMHRAAKVLFISEPSYAGWKMQVRNTAMVDASDRVLALWDGSTGGTGNCIQYAKKVGKPIVNLWDVFSSETEMET